MTDKVSHWKAGLMYCLTSLFLFFEMGVQVSPSVMTSQLMHSLNIGVIGLGFLSGCYFYSYTAMQIPSGMIFDRFNPRLVIVCALLICGLGCISLGLAPNTAFAALGRLLTGFGSAFAFVSVLVITADLFPARHFATMTGVTQMMAAFGAMSGQLPAHALVDAFGWRGTFYTFAIISFILASAVWVFLRYQKASTISEASSHSPLAKIKVIIKQPQTWLVALYACLLWAPMSTFASLWGVPFLQKVDELTASQAAMICSFMWLGLALASPLLGYLSSNLISKKQGLYLSALLGCIAFASILLFHLPSYALAILLFLSGAACSGQMLSFAVVKNQNRPDSVASAIAFNNMAVVISGAIFQPLTGYILHAFAGYGPSQQYRLGLTLVFIAYAIGLILATVCIKPKETKHPNYLTIIERGLGVCFKTFRTK